MSDITTDTESLIVRTDNLNIKYFVNAFKNNNGLVIELCKEFFDMNNHLSQNTILCRYKELIKAYLTNNFTNF